MIRMPRAPIGKIGVSMEAGALIKAYNKPGKIASIRFLDTFISFLSGCNFVSFICKSLVYLKAGHASIIISKETVCVFRLSKKNSTSNCHAYVYTLQ